MGKVERMSRAGKTLPELVRQQRVYTAVVILQAWIGVVSVVFFVRR